MKTEAKQITYIEARYLKSVGALNDTKVSIFIWDKRVRLHIRDQEFHTFASAVRGMQMMAVAS